MSSVQAKDLKKGRIAVTTNKTGTTDIPIGAWSVLVSDGVKPAPPAAGNSTGKGGGAGQARAMRSKNVCDIIFYASKYDAYEESAFLNGKRPGTAESNAARRRRSIGGVGVIELSMHEMGRLGVGLVVGENNVTGIQFDGANNDDGQRGLVQTEDW